MQVKEAYFSAKEEAELVLEHLTTILSKYSVASVADLYDLIGQPTTYVDQTFGWTNLDQAHVRELREGYTILFPSLEKIMEKMDSPNKPAWVQSLEEAKTVLRSASEQETAEMTDAKTRIAYGWVDIARMQKEKDVA